MPIDFDKMHEDAIVKAKKQKEDSEKKEQDETLKRKVAQDRNVETLRHMIEPHLKSAEEALELKGLNAQIGNDFEELKRFPYRSPKIWIQFYKDYDGNRPQYACGASYTCDNGEIIAKTTEGLQQGLIEKNSHRCKVDPIQCEQLVEKTIEECLDRLLKDS